MANKFTERAQQLLTLIVSHYIRDGQPVASAKLASESELSLSPASIRHIMADLEDNGYLHSPHTSAGRVPTPQAYRFFVNKLLTTKGSEEAQMAPPTVAFNKNTSASDLARTTSNLLSDLTHLTGIVSIPRKDSLKLSHVEFLPLSANRVLVVLVLGEQEVQNRIIHTERTFSQSELQQASNFINRHYTGRDLRAVRETLYDSMREDKAHMTDTAQQLVKMVEESLPKGEEDDYVMAGEANLLALAEAAGVDKLRSLFEAFNQKRDILHLLDKSLGAEGVQIYIGEESGYQVLGACSFVTAPYSIDGEIVGALGVIGPTRMDYGRVISMVDVTAKLLSAALNPRD